MSSHYVRTLQAWRQRFWENIAEVRAQGFDDRFIRMWDYYFQYCEGAFAERQVNVVQMTLGKPEYLGSAQATQSASRVATVITPRKRIAEQCAEGR